MTNASNRTSCLAVIALLGVALAGCEDDKKSSTASDAGAQRDKNAMLDPKIAAAFASGSADPKGPPPNGFFASGAADALHPKGAPLKVEQGSQGTEPRLALGGTEIKGLATLDVAVRAGRAAIPLSVALSFDRLKPEGKKPAAIVDAGNPFDLPVVAEVLRVAIVTEAPPPDLLKELERLKGSDFRFSLPASLLPGPLSFNRAKGARVDFDVPLESAARSLAVVGGPPPFKLFGVGGFWLVESRIITRAVEVVSYRAYRVKAVQGERMTLAVELREYATSADVELPGVAPGTPMAQFESTGQGELEVRRGELLADKATLSHRWLMAFTREGQQVGLQIQTEAHFARLVGGDAGKP